ncbi:MULTISPECIES: DUF1330 domain-containing protein [Sphingobacterium]|uniref:DUF1330 domain-containing protein n=1 Tax=Sphingobacterium TaxID=28453 RepID=UPI00257D4FCC|nr:MULTISPECIES: DUF1330 domain-containing protein [Sphingobacterium]
MKNNSKSILSAIFGMAVVFLATSCDQGSQKDKTAVDSSNEPVTEQAHGYLVGNYTISDQAGYLQYRKATEPILAKYNGKTIIYDANVKTLEGNPSPVIDVTEFSSPADAEKFYNSPEYTAAKKFRIASTENSITVLASSLSK